MTTHTDNETLARLAQDFNTAIGMGCGDNSCRYKRPKGMATNGGCRCWENRHVQHMGRRIVDYVLRRMQVRP